MDVVAQLAESMMLGGVLEQVKARWGGYRLLDHWQQGEFHHDVVLTVEGDAPDLPGKILIVATNCNGGVKEVLCLSELPERFGLWHARCPDNPEFVGAPPRILAAARTHHWFDPCELLRPDARSEYREAHRERQCGGGWKPKAS